MKLSTYAKNKEAEQPASLEAGQEFAQINSVEPYTFEFEGKEVKAIRVITDKGTFRTTGKVLIDKLVDYFAETKEPLESVRIVEVKAKSGGRKYLDMEAI